MAKGVNKVILIGNLGQEPQVSSTTNGTLVANISIAIAESRKDSSGNLQQKTEWVRCVLFNNLAKVAQDWLHKGNQVYVEGKLQTRQYEDKNGIQKSVTEVLVNELTMLGGNQSRTPYQTDEFGGGAPHDQIQNNSMREYANHATNNLNVVQNRPQNNSYGAGQQNYAQTQLGVNQSYSQQQRSQHIMNNDTYYQNGNNGNVQQNVPTSLSNSTLQSNTHLGNMSNPNVSESQNTNVYGYNGMNTSPNAPMHANQSNINESFDDDDIPF